MTPVETADRPRLKRQYPHVDNISDWRAQQSLRLLWDRIFDLEERLQQHDATLGDLVETVNAQETQLAEVARAADQALATAQLSAAEQAAVESAGLKDDHGLGAAGCAEAEATGDIGPFTGTDLTVSNACKVMCGVGNEYPALFVATATQLLRDANRDELLDRMVWHLGQAGFAAARYPTTEGRPWHVLFDAVALDGALPLRQHGYRVTDYDPIPHDPAHVMTMVTVYDGQSVGVTTTPEAGISD